MGNGSGGGGLSPPASSRALARLTHRLHVQMRSGVAGAVCSACGSSVVKGRRSRRSQRGVFCELGQLPLPLPPLVVVAAPLLLAVVVVVMVVEHWSGGGWELRSRRKTARRCLSAWPTLAGTWTV